MNRRSKLAKRYVRQGMNIFTESPGLSGRAGVSWATLLAAERVTVRKASLFPPVRRTCKISGQSSLHTKLMLFPYPLLKSTQTPKPH